MNRVEVIRAEAINNIEDFVKERGYTYTVEQMLDSYVKYYKNGWYISHSMKDCVKHLGQELELLSEGMESPQEFLRQGVTHE
jgi:hypothetical protein